MAVIDPEGGAIQSDAGQGDEATASAAAAAEAGAGADAGEDAQAQADRAREEMIARVAAETAQRVIQDWAGRQPASATPAASPTAGRGVVAELQAEGLAIQQADARLRDAIARDGLTAQNLYDQSELTRRESRFAAQVSLVGLQESERRQAVSSRAGSDDDARKRAWTAFAAEHANVDTDLLRDAFDQRWAREVAAKKPAAATTPAAAPGRAAVNVSGASEVSAREVRARAMSRDAANQHRATLRAEGRDSEAAAFDRDIRGGKVLIKG